MGSRPLLGIHLLRREFLSGLQVDICSTVDLHRLHGHRLPHAGLLHGLQENLALAPGAPPAPLSSLTLVSAELFLISSLLSSAAIAVMQVFFLS